MINRRGGKMTDNKPNEESVTMEKAIVKRKKGISPIWILPLVAALIGVWLIYKGIVEAPIKVVINFETAGGITAGKTKVFYKGLKTGVVKSVQILPRTFTMRPWWRRLKDFKSNTAWPSMQRGMAEMDA